MMVTWCACRYELLMQAFGGEGYAVNSRQQLAAACRQAFAAGRPALINVAIDPMAGVESGADTLHASRTRAVAST